MLAVDVQGFLHDVIRQLVKLLYRFCPLLELIEGPVLKIFPHINLPSRIRKDLYKRFAEVNAGLFITYPAPVSGFCYRGVIFLAAYGAVGAISAGFGSALIEYQIAAAAAVPTCLPQVIVLPVEVHNEVRMFNLLDMANGDAWNCLSEIKKDKDLAQFIAEVVIKNTSNANERQDFWEKAELNLLMALMHYVASQTAPGTKDLLPIQQRSLGAIYRMLSNESFADLEKRFQELPKDHPALPPYGIFKLANRQI